MNTAAIAFPFSNSILYCPRPGWQSAKPNASVSRKLAIEIAYYLRSRSLRDNNQSYL
ncbi:hypothetical protein [Pseudanabaena sp. PCC 6802]|uniref:hypothetical protein n=1 Tax=Pseudanabaena sp. PCC 6802 TaxID=118173 RepID=UPI00035D987A|nr:hypothetical protein [Pseudanabaena sp. PCC 6802]